MTEKSTKQNRVYNLNGYPDTCKIDRFTSYIERTISPQGIQFYNEILDEIEKSFNYNSAVETDNLQYHSKIIEVVRLLKILQRWIDEGKFSSMESIKTYADYVISKILPDHKIIEQ